MDRNTRCVRRMIVPPSTRTQSTELTEHFKTCVPNHRIDTLQRKVDLVLAMVINQSVNTSDLAPEMPGSSSPGEKNDAWNALFVMNSSLCTSSWRCCSFTFPRGRC